MVYNHSGPDTSYAQGAVNPGSFPGDMAIVNASRANTGSLVTGSYYHQQVTAFRSNGRYVGHYFFNGNIDPTACADYFVANLFDYRSGDALWLDVESELATGTVAWNPTQALTFINRVKAHGLPAPGIYLNKSLETGYDWSACRNAGAELWSAYYNSTMYAPRNWPTAEVWQHSSSPYDQNKATDAGVNASPTPTTQQGENDTMIILRSQSASASGLIPKGFSFMLPDSGPARPLSKDEYEAYLWNRDNAGGPHIPFRVADWAGDQIEKLTVPVGLLEWSGMGPDGFTPQFTGRVHTPSGVDYPKVSGITSSTPDDSKVLTAIAGVQTSVDNLPVPPVEFTLTGKAKA